MELIKKNLNRFSIFDKMEDNDYYDIQNIISERKYDEKTNRAIGSVVGMAVGDFTGGIVEFSNATKYFNLKKIKIFDVNKCSYKIVNNVMKLKFGQWTDDASMGLCMADSLIELKKFDGVDMRKRFWNWWVNGYNNAFRFEPNRFHSIGLGGNISKSLISLKKENPIKPFFKTDPPNEDSGNGSIMRLAPVPVFYSKKIDDVVKYSKLSSLTTHQGILASEACGLLGFIIAKAIERESNENIQEFIDRILNEYLEKYKPIEEIKRLIKSNEKKTSKELSWNWKDEVIDIEQVMINRGKKYNGYFNNVSYFGSFSIDGLAIALNSVYYTNSFDEAIERSISYLGDADSTTSVTGQIAGAFYGYSSINNKLIQYLNKWDNEEIGMRGYLLYNSN